MKILVPLLLFYLQNVRCFDSNQKPDRITMLHNHVLINSTFYTNFGHAWVDCIQKCKGVRKCKSINYIRKLGLCELNDVDQTTNPEALKTKVGSTFTSKSDWNFREPEHCDSCADGEFCSSDQDKQCEIFGCPPPPPVAGAKILGNLFDIGTKRLYRCSNVVLFCWLLAGIKISYGRYVKHDGIRLSSKLAWFVFELPGIIIPAMFLLYGACPRLEYLPNRLYLGLFVAHCFHRTLIYPLLMKSGRTVSLSVFLAFIIFITHNGYLHSAYLLYHAKFEEDWLNHANTYIGIGLFVAGMLINIHSDHILRSLRSPSEIDMYRIPRGGMFEYVSGANFFGEILEWLGFAIGTWSLPGAAFAFFVVCNIGPRAFQHHRYYKEKFDDYPKDRKALIPFIA